MGYVYLIWQEGTDLYKIGMTNGEAKSRLTQLQSGNPSKLELLCTLPSSSPESKESELHEKWAEYRVQGEWFKIHPSLLNELFGSFGHYFQDPVFTRIGSRLGAVIMSEFQTGLVQAVETTSLAMLRALNSSDNAYTSAALTEELDDAVFELTARRVICDLYQELDKRQAKIKARADFDKKYQSMGL